MGSDLPENLATGAAEPPPPAAFAVAGERPVVLVVDDEPQILQAVVDTLEEECTVYTATSAAAALERIAAHPELSVLLSDQRMPVMCGDELLARAKGISSAVAIMITGYADLEAVIRAVNQGKIFGYLSKPWGHDELRLMVQAAHSHHRLQRELATEQQLLRELLDNTTDLIFYQDLEQRFIRTNRRYAALLGRSRPEDLIGRPVREFLGAAEAHPLDAADQAVLRSGQPATDQWVSSRLPGSGETRWFSTTRAPIRDERGEVAGLVGIARDVTERVQVLEALRLRERAIESSANSVVIVDCHQPDMPIVYANPAFERITGYPLGEAMGRNPRFLHGGDRDQPGLAEIREAVRGKRAGHGVFRNHRKDGGIYWADLYVAPVHDSEGDCTHFIGVQYDITDRIRYQEELERHANFDTLTGVANRNLLTDRLGQALASANRRKHVVGLLSLALDRFQQVAASLGHLAGDQILLQVTARLAEFVREGDTVARVGADEFSLVLTDLPGAEDAARVAQRVLAALAQPFITNDSEVSLTTSIGLCIYPGDGELAEHLMQHANIARQQASSAGGNQHCFYTPAMNAAALQRQVLEHALRHALERQELVVHYQPRVSLRDGRVVGMESLLRWQHPEMGLISPMDFIPLAEETGLIVAIGEWVIDKACRQTRAWLDAGLSVPPVAINLSARQFRAETLATAITDALRTHGLEARQLELEITESTAMVDVDKAVATLGQLRALGVALALDDFGTGYSSLAYLKRFPINYLKIDKAFVRDLTWDPDDAAICIATINLAHSLKLQVIAEGVETAGQMEYLRRHGCDEMQGFYFSKPLPADALAQLLADQRRMTLKPLTGASEEPTLLIVDDEPGIAASLMRHLRHDGYRILTASSAREGLEILANEIVHVILADERMPEMSGSEFLARAKDLHPNTLRMVLSGYANVETIANAINRGVIYKFFLKPWDDQELREAIRGAFTRLAHGRKDAPPSGP